MKNAPTIKCTMEERITKGSRISKVLYRKLVEPYIRELEEKNEEMEIEIEKLKKVKDKTLNLFRFLTHSEASREEIIEHLDITFREYRGENGEVVYMGSTDDQVNFCGDDPRGILEEGKAYRVEKKEVFNWYTKLKLKGIDGEFNSVCFREIKKQGES